MAIRIQNDRPMPFFNVSGHVVVRVRGSATYVKAANYVSERLSVCKEPGLPFTQSLQTRPSNLLLAYTRRRKITMEAVNVAATVAANPICAPSTVIVPERLPCR
jgi:hypothetical protein